MWSESSPLIRIWGWNPKHLTPLNVPQVIVNAQKKNDDQCFTPSTEGDWGSPSRTSIEAGAKDHYIYSTGKQWEGRVIPATSTEGDTEERCYLYLCKEIVKTIICSNNREVEEQPFKVSTEKDCIHCLKHPQREAENYYYGVST